MLRAVPALASRINVVYLYVRDLERSLAFYRDVLGIPLEDQDGHWAEARLDGLRFALHAADEAQPGTVWIDFEVDDIDAALGKTVELGGSVLRGAEDTPYGRLAAAADPTRAQFKLVAPNATPERSPA